jgi:hypothetical protein
VRFFKYEMKHYFRFLKFVMRYYYCREMSTLELQGESNWRLVRSNWRMELERLKIFFLFFDKFPDAIVIREFCHIREYCNMQLLSGNFVTSGNIVICNCYQGILSHPGML